MEMSISILNKKNLDEEVVERFKKEFASELVILKMEGSELI